MYTVDNGCILKDGVNYLSMYSHLHFPKVDEERREGESWIAMRVRTEPERMAITKAINEELERIADALNKA